MLDKTHYTIAILNEDFPIEEELKIIDHLRSLYVEARYSLTKIGTPISSGYWIMHEDNLKRFSMLYPDIVFALWGTGENLVLVWMKYFKKGKMQTSQARIYLDEYDESLLE